MKLQYLKGGTEYLNNDDVELAFVQIWLNDVLAITILVFQSFSYLHILTGEKCFSIPFYKTLSNWIGPSVIIFSTLWIGLRPLSIHAVLCGFVYVLCRYLQYFVDWFTSSFIICSTLWIGLRPLSLFAVLCGLVYVLCHYL